MKVIMPMAGHGSRYAAKGYDDPKPFVSILGRPMFCRALESIRGIPVSLLIIVALKEHDEKYDISSLLRKEVSLPFKLVLLDEVTEGQLSTILKAGEWIDSEEDVLIISSDTIVLSSIGSEIAENKERFSGLISVIDVPGDNWSFVKTDARGEVIQVAEKERISNNASTGLYYFSSGKDLVQYGNQMIRSGKKTKGEYYVIPVYQEFISAGLKVGISEAREMWDLGTPENKARFEAEFSHL
jgi:UDP-N-acetylglucosamine diphosphorylase / glucose-1-phosphate thymidylyltransferase / UDP-N-acetylgalactosamine diphosphorylase / glucosamine-1-phosphate N-acetyltransferase / galactosamine-1-phosphate N-acetyltransferase